MDTLQYLGLGIISMITKNKTIKKILKSKIYLFYMFFSAFIFPFLLTFILNLLQENGYELFDKKFDLGELFYYSFLQFNLFNYNSNVKNIYLKIISYIHSIIFWIAAFNELILFLYTQDINIFSLFK